MALNSSATDMMLNNKMAVELDLEELKLNIDNMFLIVNGIIVSREYMTCLNNNIFGVFLAHFKDDFKKYFSVHSTGFLV